MIRLTKDILTLTNLEFRNTPECYLTCRQSNLISQTSQVNWRHRIEEDPSIEMYGLESDNGEAWIPVGTAGFTSIRKDHGTAEYSLLIFPANQGKGYAKEGLEALLRFGFENWSWLNLVWGEIFHTNDAGLHIAEKAGFTVEGTLRDRYFKQGKRVSTYIASITREEWYALHP